MIRHKPRKQSILSFSIDAWRAITNLWTFLTLAFIILDFFSYHQYSDSTSLISTIYITVLGIYASSKEFDRWRHQYQSKSYLGELSAVLWTVVIVILLIISLVNKKYLLNVETATTYVIVLGILIITNKSKSLYEKRKPKKRKKGINN